MIDIDSLTELAAERRSIRGFDESRDVPDDSVRKKTCVEDDVDRSNNAAQSKSEE